MRVSGGFLITALLAAAFALYLTGRDATSSLNAVTAAADGLREEGVVGKSIDLDSATRMIAAMETLLEAPDNISDHVDDLRVFADTAASWAAGAPPASLDLHIAVSIRSAAGDLRAHALRPSETSLRRARRRLDQARRSLEGGARGEDGAEERLVTDGLRDQLQNLEQSHREQQQQIDEALRK